LGWAFDRRRGQLENAPDLDQQPNALGSQLRGAATWTIRRQDEETSAAMNGASSSFEPPRYSA